MEKKIKKYVKVYQKVLSHIHADNEQLVMAYEKRLRDMYDSENFQRHNRYPSTDTVHIYAVIAMCLELKEMGMDNESIINAINSGFSARRNFFKRLIQIIDILPNAYKIAEKWNISDHEKRVKDGSITYDYFKVTEGKMEYCISKCVYVDMFETYGIRPLCKIFCMTDTTAYDNLTKHVQFIRHSDLSDGKCCHDEILKRN